MKKFLIALTMVALGCISAYSVTQQINFQGRLTNPSGVPIIVNTAVDFKLYSTITGGSPINGTTITKNITPDKNGIFNTLLEFDNSYFDGTDRYMEISIGVETLSPRQMVSVVPYAYYALTAESIAGGAGGNFVLKTGDTMSGSLTIATNESIILGQNPASGNGLQLISFVNNIGIGARVNTSSDALYFNVDTTGAGSTRLFLFGNGNIVISDNLGVGTITGATVSNRLVVNGTIETIGTGGIKFPDGSTQITAAGAAGDYVLKTGDTMTGTLNISNASGGGITISNPNNPENMSFPTAPGIGSIALGTASIASGQYSIALGTYYSGATVASGLASLAIGSQSTASGDMSIAHGRESRATQTNSVAIGDYMIVNGENSIGISLGSGGTISSADTMAIMGGNVGIGTVDPQSLLHVAGDISSEGNVYVIGNLYVHGTIEGMSPLDMQGPVNIYDGLIVTGIITGDGSGISNITGTDNTKVSKAGDKMTGVLTLEPDGTNDLALVINGGGSDTFYHDDKTAINARGKLQVGFGLYGNAIAKGDESIAIGNNTTATGTNSIAFGNNASAEGSNSFAGGQSTLAQGTAAVAMGYGNTASGDYSFAAGNSSTASGSNAFAFGNSAKSTTYYSIAIGNAASAGGEQNTIALGANARATKSGAISQGTDSIANNYDAIAIGTKASAGNTNSIAIGALTSAEGSSSAAIGNSVRAIDPASYVFGSSSTAGGSGSVVVGANSDTYNSGSFIFGQSAKVGGSGSMALGHYHTVAGSGSYAIGSSVSVEGNNSMGIAVGGTTYIVTQPNVIAIMGGNVGIGQVSPKVKLDVAGDISSEGNVVVIGTLGVGVTSTGGDKFEVDGRAYASGGWQTTNADYAEWFIKEGDPKAGDIIGINLGTGKARKYESGDKFIGIVSTKPSIVGNRTSDSDEEMALNCVLVALLGQVDVNVSQVTIDNRIVTTVDGKEIGILLDSGKLLIGR